MENFHTPKYKHLTIRLLLGNFASIIYSLLDVTYRNMLNHNNYAIHYASIEHERTSNNLWSHFWRTFQRKGRVSIKGGSYATVENHFGIDRTAYNLLLKLYCSGPHSNRKLGRRLWGLVAQQLEHLSVKQEMRIRVPPRTFNFSVPTTGDTD